MYKPTCRSAEDLRIHSESIRFGYNNAYVSLSVLNASNIACMVCKPLRIWKVKSLQKSKINLIYFN